jgi:light-regulated signal transduction histidine kinase (bacteriophytochrome)
VGTGNVIVWFRLEIARVITWAGDPSKPAANASQPGSLTPRQSFAAWTVEARGHSRPWTTSDIAAANSLRNTLLTIVALRSADLQRVNAQLLHSNAELESFAYVASQVLQNLIGNAIKYRHASRPLVLTIKAEQRPAQVDARLTDLPVLALHVEDNGIGFDERHCEQIFKPFERLHSAEEYPGSGLGLTICRQVVERHGGSITAASRPGKGSVFTVNLPLRPLSTQEI